jgi:predicted  nucleic acid-binding Zn-ribbon protein
MTTAADIYALQETDLALDRALQRLSDIEAGLGESEELIEARQEMEAKRAVVTDLRARLKDLEWSVDEVRSKATEVETKLYGGTVRNPKELSDLDLDLKSVRAQVARREDALLGHLVELEEAETQLAAAEENRAHVEAGWQAGQQALLQEKGQIEPEVERLQAVRESQPSGIDRASLNLYELLRARRGGRAVATVERGMCQGCRITLPMSILQKARAGLGLVQCVSCERILLVS